MALDLGEDEFYTHGLHKMRNAIRYVSTKTKRIECRMFNQQELRESGSNYDENNMNVLIG